MKTSRHRSTPVRLLAALAAVSLALAACADDDETVDDVNVEDTTDDDAAIDDQPSETETPPAQSPPPADPDTTGPDATDPDTTDPDTTDPETTGPDTTGPDTTGPATGGPDDVELAPMGDPEVDFVEIAQLDQPIGLAFRNDDPTLFFVEQAGRVVALDLADDSAAGEARTVLDITSLTAAQGERGLLGLAFSPDGANAYVNYTDATGGDSDGDTVVAEYPVDAEGMFDADSPRELFRIAQPYGNHNGGHLVTGPDGLLYVGMGDGGSGGDPERRALDVTTRLGKLLRIDPTPSADLPYTIPTDNPFVDVPDARPEIFSIGLRNPWKFQFDPVTGDLWIADVGQNRLEEINHVPAPSPAPAEGPGVAGAGLSFGWSAFEGDERFNDDVDPDGHTAPVFTYDHTEGECSISGGAPYRGSAIPELASGYVYSDLCSGRIWAFDLAGERNVLLGQLASVVAVLPGPDQELYVISHDGPVHRIVDVDAQN